MHTSNQLKTNTPMPTILSVFLIAVLLSLSNSVCGQKKDKRPDWVDNVQNKYSDNFYIASLGVGDTHESAKKKAAAGIAERFKTTIRVEQNYLQRYNSFTDLEGKTAEAGTEELEKQIDTYADETLFNIAYGNFYTDENGRIYVVGYIDRKKTAPIYADKIRENDRQIDNYLTKGKKKNDPVERFAYINAAYIISLYSEQLREQLSIIDQNSVPLTIVSHADVVDARTKAAGNIKFSIAVSGDDENEIYAKIAEIISKTGFRIVNEETSSNVLSIASDISFEKVELERRNLEFIAWNLKIEMKDINNNVLLALNKTSRDGGKSVKTAQRMAYRSIHKYLESNFSSELSAFFDKNVKREKF